MTFKHFERDAVVCTPSSRVCTARSRRIAWQLRALLFVLAAAGCNDAKPEPGRAGRVVEVDGTREALFNNGDFESGPAGQNTPTGWTLTPYRNTGVTRQTPQRARA